MCLSVYAYITHIHMCMYMCNMYSGRPRTTAATASTGGRRTSGGGCLYIYIYIYIYRERESEREIYIYMSCFSNYSLDRPWFLAGWR